MSVPHTKVETRRKEMMTRDALLSIAYRLSWYDTFSWYVALLVASFALYYVVAVLPRTQSIKLLYILLFPASCAIGITLAYLASQTLSLLFATVAFLIVATLLFFTKNTLLIPCLLLSAAIGLRTTTSHTLHQHITALLRQHPCTINGIVASKEEWLNHPKGCILTIQTTHVHYTPLSTSLRYYLYRTPTLQVGDAVAIFKVQNTEKDNEDEAFSRYRWRHGLSALFFQPTLRARLIARPATHWTIAAWWHRLRAALYERLRAAIPKPVFAYCGSLFFGNRDHDGINETRQLFSRWGLVHYLARSGLHIALIIMLWSSMLLWLPLPLHGKLILLLCLLYLYSMLSWTSLSYQRALWLFVLLCGAAFLRRRPRTLHLLSLLTTVTLLYSPATLFFLDFQLTFFLTFVLLVLTMFLHRATQKR